MSKKQKKEMESTNDGSRAINKLKISDIVIMAILIILCLTCILPFIHLAAKSVSADSYVIAKKVFFWPKGFNITAYKAVFEDGRLVYSFGYSVFMTALFTLLGMIVCTCAAYPLSRRRLKGRNWLSFLLMVPMYFSAGLIPSYVLMNDLHLIDTMWALILPLIFSPYNMLIMKSFFQSSIPDTLEEAAFLDGATNFQTLFKVVLPLSKSIIATLSLFYAVGRWNAYADAKYYIRMQQKLKPIQLLLSEMVATASEAANSAFEAVVNLATPEVLQAAAIMFVTLPIICIYPFVQKYFVKGVMIGAVKG